jgi:adenosylcobinamide-GDP ribazoletransferase
VRSLLVAASFLTRVPVSVAASGRDVRLAVRWFPLVGALIGVAGALLARVFAEVPAMSAPLQAWVLVGLGAWITGAIHLDGLADAADGWGGGRTRDDVLRIMRDPRIGSFGAVALIVIVGIKVAALAALLDSGAAMYALIAAPALSRWTAVVLGAWLPNARAEEGLAGAVAGQLDRGGVLVATVSTAAIATAAAGISAIVLGLVSSAVVCLVGASAKRRLGGVTGDVFGATIELTETAVLVATVVFSGSSAR